MSRATGRPRGEAKRRRRAARRGSHEIPADRAGITIWPRPRWLASCTTALVDLLAASDLEKKTDFEDKKALENCPGPSISQADLDAKFPMTKSTPLRLVDPGHRGRPATRKLTGHLRPLPNIAPARLGQIDQGA